MPPTFTVASVNHYTPMFTGIPQRLTWCQQFGLQIFPKWGDADFFHKEMAVFRCFFWLNKFSRSNGWLSPTACHTYLKSLCINGQFWLSGNHFSASYEASDFCWQIGLNFLQYLRPYRILFCIVTWQTCEPKAHHCVVLASNYLSSWLRFSPI